MTLSPLVGGLGACFLLVRTRSDRAARVVRRRHDEVRTKFDELESLRACTLRITCILKYLSRTTSFTQRYDCSVLRARSSPARIDRVAAYPF
jgi:hypothetical protein